MYIYDSHFRRLSRAASVLAYMVNIKCLIWLGKL